MVMPLHGIGGMVFLFRGLLRSTPGYSHDATNVADVDRQREVYGVRHPNVVGLWRQEILPRTLFPASCMAIA